MSGQGVAAEMLQCALAHDPEARMIGNVKARDIAALAASVLTQCPTCGSEAWANIDCQVCWTATLLLVEWDGTGENF